MIRLAIVGLGKMGLSHLAIARAHPEIDLVAGCDPSRHVRLGLEKYANLKCYGDYAELLRSETLDAVLIATPSRLHAGMVSEAIDRGLHVFCEKPFVLDCNEGEDLVARSRAKGVVTQVGYHYRHVGAFREAARVVASGAIGSVHHIRAEAYGPVVVKAKGSTWRSSKSEGGGALYDYACHAVDLMHYIFRAPTAVAGAVVRSVFSRDVDDEVYATMLYDGGATGQLCVNWSDESFRKMSTKVSVWGERGRVVADRQECQVYLRQSSEALPDYGAGWTVRYTTDLTDSVWFYLRGEEYSAQIDYFVQSVKSRRLDGKSCFASALEADRVVSWIAAGAGGETGKSGVGRDGGARRRGLLSRLVGR